MILLVNQPPVPLITKIRTASVTLANRTVSPTRSCDHFSCFWLGKVVRRRQEHNNKRGGIQEGENGKLESGQKKAPNSTHVSRRVGAFFSPEAGRLAGFQTIRLALAAAVFFMVLGSCRGVIVVMRLDVMIVCVSII